VRELLSARFHTISRGAPQATEQDMGGRIYSLSATDGHWCDCEEGLKTYRDTSPIDLPRSFGGVLLQSEVTIPLA